VIDTARWLRVALACVVLAGLVAYAGPETVAHLIATASGELLALGLAALAASHLIHGMTFRLLAHGLPVTFWECVSISVRSWAWGTVTPGRLGDFSAAIYLRDRGVDLGVAAAIALLDRATAVAGLALIGLWAWLVVGVPTLEGSLFVLAAICLSTATGVLLFRRGAWAVRWVPPRWREHLATFTAELERAVVRSPAAAALATLTQVARFLVLYFITSLLFLSVGENVPFATVCAVNTAARLSALVPLTINGLGVREGTMLLLYRELASLPPEPIMAVALWLNAFMFGGALIGYAFFALARRRASSGTTTP
jgi:uncharacterized membrane protein YbhN (UPF0104 family)